MRIVAIAVLLGVVMAASDVVRAESFSDLNMGMFRKQVHPGGSGSDGSPFAGGAALPEDLVIEDLQLMGIIVGSSDAYALISGYVVEEGDLIAGFKVTSIQSDKVVLKRLDEVFVLTLGGGY